MRNFSQITSEQSLMYTKTPLYDLLISYQVLCHYPYIFRYHVRTDGPGKEAGSTKLVHTVNGCIFAVLLWWRLDGPSLLVTVSKKRKWYFTPLVLEFW